VILHNAAELLTIEGISFRYQTYFCTGAQSVLDAPHAIFSKASAHYPFTFILGQRFERLGGVFL
jgi:hypothetical protein